MYDIIIIGGGPAGLTSAIYAKEAGKSVLVLEKIGAGGQVNNIFNVTNYPGFVGINGFELAQKFKEQANLIGAEFKSEEVVDVRLDKPIKKVKTTKDEYEAKNIIIATGANAKKLGINKEDYFYGRGISSCATCDGNLFKNKVVAVVGGGNSGISDCLYLKNIAKKVYLIHRRDEFRASASGVATIKNNNDKIEIITNSVITKLIGDEKLNAIEITDAKTGKGEVIDVDGVFVAIGRSPQTDIFKDKLNLDKNGHIITNNNMETSQKGVYAVGDVRNTNLRQIVTACADGALAVNAIVNGEQWMCFVSRWLYK